MAVDPPKLEEAIVRWLLPPACREQVLGDLHECLQDTEHCQARQQYRRDARSVLPFVILSQVRRAANPLLLCAEAVAVYASFVAAAFWMLGSGALAFLNEQHGMAVIGGITLATLVVLALADAYTVPERNTALVWRELVRVGLAFAASFVIGGLSVPFTPGLSFPGRIVFYGVLLGLVAIPTVRLLIAVFLKDDTPSGKGA